MTPRTNRHFGGIYSQARAFSLCGTGTENCQTVDESAAAQSEPDARSAAVKATAQAPQRTIIPVKNLSGADRERFDVLEISRPLFDINSDAGKKRPMATGVKPGGPSGKIAVFLEPAKVGEIARACVSGVTVARVKLVEK
jgi:hypothetical protein